MLHRTIRHPFVTRLGARARRGAEALAAFSRDESGLETVEWLLVVGSMIVPLTATMLAVLNAMVFYYEVTSWILALPFP